MRSVVRGLGGAWLGLLTLGCGPNPEDLVEAKWQEVRWSYEMLDRPPKEIQRIDGIRVDAFEGRSIGHHESESWWLRRDRTFVIALRDGTPRKGRWRLKGRGHILTLRYDDGTIEVYDVKELSQRRMVLNLDLGMEVRGIARLDFSREIAADPSDPSDEPTRSSARSFEQELVSNPSPPRGGSRSLLSITAQPL